MTLISIFMISVNIIFSYLEYLLMNLPGQPQRYKVKVFIKKITMNIKFPCNLTAQLKFQSSTELKKSYELLNGECFINDSLEIDIEVPQNANKRFQERKVMVYVFMISQSGKISAGYALISLVNRQIGHTFEQVQFLQKCPDKNAKIFFNYHVEIPFNNKSQKLDKTLINDLKFNDFKNTDRMDDKKDKYNLGSNNSMTYHMDSLRNKNSMKVLLHSNNNANIDESHVQQNVIGSKTYKGVLSQRYNTEYLKQRQSQSRSRSRSIKQAKQLKNIASLIPLTNANQSLSKYIDQDENIQVFKLKQKLKYAEKVDRTNQIHLKELKEQTEKRKNRVIYLESINADIQKTLKHAEEKFKRSQKESKELKEQKQELFGQIKSLKNQNDLKQGILKQQLKKIEQKYKNSELQREKVVQSYNKILKTTEQNEKKHQLAMKDKDKLFNEQKSKSNKRNEQLNTRILQLQSKVKQLDLIIQQHKKQSKMFIQKQSSFKQTIQQVSVDNSEYIQRNNRNIQIINNLEEQIKILKEYQAQKQLLKKKNHEILLQNSKLIEKIGKLQKHISNQEQKNKQLENQLGKKNLEKTQINNKYLSLKKSYDQLKRTQEQKYKQIQSLNFTHNNDNQKISDWKSKFQSQKKNFNEMHKEFEMRYSEIVLMKQNLQGQVDEAHWQIQKNLGMIQQLNNQVKTFNELNYKLNEEMIDKNQRIKRIQENGKQLTTSSQYLKQSVCQLEEKKRQNNMLIKNFNIQVNDLKKKIQKVQKQLYDQKDKYKLYENITKDKLNQSQKRLKQKEQSLANKNNEYYTLQNKCKQSQEQNNILKQTINTSNQQLNYVKDTLSILKKQLQLKEINIMKIREQQNQLKKENTKKQQELYKYISQNQIINANLKKQIIDLNNQIKNIIDNISNYFTELIKNQEQNKVINVNKIYYTSINQKILELQILYIQKRNNSLLRCKSIEEKLIKEKDELRYQINKNKIQFQESRESNYKQFIHQSEKNKKNHLENTQIINFYKESIEKWESNIVNKDKEIQEIKLQVLKTTQERNEIEMQLQLMINQFDLLKQQNNSLEQKILKLKTQEIKEKSIYEQRHESLLENHELDKLKYLKDINQLQKHVNSHVKTIHQYQETLKKIQYQQNANHYEKQKLQSKITELQQKNNYSLNESKTYSIFIKQKQRQIKKMSQKNEEMSAKLIAQKQRSQELNFKNQSLNEILLGLQKDIEQSRQQLLQIKKISQTNNTQNKLKIQSLKNQQDKLTLEGKQLKQKNIMMISQADMNKFVIKQLETSLKIQKQSKQEIKEQLYNKKSQKSTLQFQLNVVKSKSTNLQMQFEETRSQNDRINKILQKLKYQNHQLKNYQKNLLNNNKILGLQKDKQRLQTQIMAINNNYQKIINDLRNNINQYKKHEINKHNHEQQLKKKLKIAERLLEANNSTAHLEYKRITQEIQKQKRELLSKNQNFQLKIKYLQDQLLKTKQKSRKQLQKSIKDREQTESLLSQTEQKLKDYIVELNNLTYRFNEIGIQKNRLQNSHQRQLQKISKNIKEKEAQVQMLKIKLKNLEISQNRELLQSIENELGKIKTKKINTNENQIQKLIMINSYREIQSILKDMKKTKSTSNGYKKY